MTTALQNFTMGFLEKIYHELRFSEKYNLESFQPRTIPLGIVTTTKALYRLLRALPDFGGGKIHIHCNRFTHSLSSDFGLAKPLHIKAIDSVCSVDGQLNGFWA
jgi:hypothetical protein